MHRVMCKSKIHRATVTGADLQYEGSITVDPVLAGGRGHPGVRARPGGQPERTAPASRPTRSRVSAARARSCLNGAAARLVQPGTMYHYQLRLLDEAELDGFEPRLVFVDEHNPGPARAAMARDPLLEWAAAGTSRLGRGVPGPGGITSRASPVRRRLGERARSAAGRAHPLERRRLAARRAAGRPRRVAARGRAARRRVAARQAAARPGRRRPAARSRRRGRRRAVRHCDRYGRAPRPRCRRARALPRRLPRARPLLRAALARHPPGPHARAHGPRSQRGARGAHPPPHRARFRRPSRDDRVLERRRGAR